MNGKREIIAEPKKKDMPFSAIVAFDRLVFVSGMVGRNIETGQLFR